MIIDLILDRKDGEKYNPRKFYYDCMQYGGVFAERITYCMDYFGESMVKRAICEYVYGSGYNPELYGYINSVNWLIPDGAEE